MSGEYRIRKLKLVKCLKQNTYWFVLKRSSQRAIINYIEKDLPERIASLSDLSEHIEKLINIAVPNVSKIIKILIEKTIRAKASTFVVRMKN